MTKEEQLEQKAEKIADKLVEKGCVTIAEYRARQDIQYAFRKGAEFGYNKANEWHDFEKDPNDLPEKMGTGSKEVYISYDDKVTDFAYYCFDEKLWRRSENEETLQGTVIAWCEIPQFKEIE